MHACICVCVCACIYATFVSIDTNWPARTHTHTHAHTHRELTALGTVGEAHSKGVVRCLGFGFTADLWPYLVLEHGGAPLAVVSPFFFFFFLFFFVC